MTWIDAHPYLTTFLVITFLGFISGLVHMVHGCAGCPHPEPISTEDWD